MFFFVRVCFLSREFNNTFRGGKPKNLKEDLLGRSFGGKNVSLHSPEDTWVPWGQKWDIFQNRKVFQLWFYSFPKKIFNVLLRWGGFLPPNYFVLFFFFPPQNAVIKN